MILIQNADIGWIKSITSEIVKYMKEPYYIHHNKVIITTSIGISLYPDHTNNLVDLIKMADTAMYHAKLDGKNTYKVFNNDLKLQLERRALIETEIRKAINSSELFIHYQPKYDLCSQKLVGLEALIRWKSATIGMVSPQEFIPISEETGFISEIGNWVIKEVIRQMKEWHDLGYTLVKTSVNVSQRQFRDKHLVQYIKSCLCSFDIPAKYFEIEVTESVMEDFELVVPKLRKLKEFGISISIDDFGTGYSSLNLLKDLPVDALKIDQSFVRDLLGNTKETALVKTILEIGNTLNLQVIAEGIETEEHFKLLREFDCPIGQGYYFSKPISALELEKEILSKNN